MNIGQKVIKSSGKPFSNGAFIVTVKDITSHPDPTRAAKGEGAFTFEETDDVVGIAQCSAGHPLALRLRAERALARAQDNHHQELVKVHGGNEACSIECNVATDCEAKRVATPKLATLWAKLTAAEEIYAASKRRSYLQTPA